MQLKTTIERRLPKSLFHVLASIGFWNEKGNEIWEQNKAGKLGNARTQEEARKMEYSEYIFNCLLSDLQTFSKSSDLEYWMPGYKYGRGGNHIWVSDNNNQRILFIHF